MLGLHVVFAVDRAGLVGEDGETHHGVFDVGFLRHGPGLTVLCPASTKELRDMLTWSIEEQNGPVAVRYPRGGDGSYHDSAWRNDPKILSDGAVAVHEKGNDVAIIVYGTLLENALTAASLLKERGIEASVVRLLTVSPLPFEAVSAEIKGIEHVVILEECMENGGVHSVLAEEIQRKCGRIRVDTIHLGRSFVTHGSVTDLYKHCGLDAKSVADFIQEVHQNEN